VIISEMLGDGVYQAPAGSSLDFHGGSVRDVTAADGMLCGCSEPPPLKPEPPQLEVAKKSPPPPPPPVELPPETHVQVDAPFIYNGDAPDNEVVYTLAKLGTDKTLTVKLAPTVLPPPKHKKAPNLQPVNTASLDTSKKESHNIFRSIGRFFGKIFGS
jgi:hypothetical protein